ncbi:MAG: hypothetical protein JWO33_956 [Caulobacteraceae bacterium]|nr:hypothetical protein [Caulobacteraceae bacterium]
MERAQVHYEVWTRRKPGAGWSLELAVEDRERAIETAEELFATAKAVAVKVSKETLDEDSREFKTVNILSKGDTKETKVKKAKDTLDPLCVSPADLYTGHARERIGRLLHEWLTRQRVTPFELLHRADLIEKLEAAGMDLQHAVQKIAVPEAQDRGVSVHELIRHYHKLIQTAIDRVLNDYKRKAFPNIEEEGFGPACERLTGEPERHYLLGGGVARHIGKGATWSEKVAFLLDLADAAPQVAQARALAFQVLETSLAEILGSRAGMTDLLGPELDLGGNLAAMTRLAASDTVDLLVGVEPVVARMMPVLKGPAARLANWLEGPQFEMVRAALAQRVLRELTSPRRLRPDDPAGEINILRALAMCLTAAAGKLMPLEQVQDAFAERSRMLVRSDFVEVYLGEDKNALEEVEALLWLAENITGAANKRSASRWIGANIAALRFERDVRSDSGSPATRLANLANLQRGVARVGLLGEEIAPIQVKVGEVAGWVEADAKLIHLLGRASAPLAQRITLLTKLATGETAPLGPVTERARQEIMRLMRAPEARAEVGQHPELLAKVRDLIQQGGLAA